MLHARRAVPLDRVAARTTSVAHLVDQSWHFVTPTDDDKPRKTCTHCGFVQYRNPLPVAGVVAVTRSGKIMLGRRSIAPRAGWWGLPGGFLEVGESAAQGAAREALEECGARVVVRGLLAMYSLPRISQVHFWYAADWDGAEETFCASHETDEVTLFEANSIPWSKLAFPSGRLALQHAVSPLVLPQLLRLARDGWPAGWDGQSAMPSNSALYPLPVDVRDVHEMPGELGE